MQSILILNSKGGCGKTTIATNLASRFALDGSNVMLADYDPQGSGLQWLEKRPAQRPTIVGVAAWRDPVRAPQKPDYLIMDAPARVAGSEFKSLMRHANTILIPVLPSPIDIRACAQFMRHVLLAHRAMRHAGRLAVVANRVRETTLIYEKLCRFLSSLEIPFVATLRETQNYIRAAEQGLGVFELPGSVAAQDVAQWQPLLEWIQAPTSANDDVMFLPDSPDGDQSMHGEPTRL